MLKSLHELCDLIHFKIVSPQLIKREHIYFAPIFLIRSTDISEAKSFSDPSF